jgi:hypothetical protein
MFIILFYKQQNEINYWYETPGKNFLKSGWTVDEKAGGQAGRQ